MDPVPINAGALRRCTHAAANRLHMDETPSTGGIDPAECKDTSTAVTAGNRTLGHGWRQSIGESPG